MRGAWEEMRKKIRHSLLDRRNMMEIAFKHDSLRSEPVGDNLVTDSESI
jgi:hypothetical protein